MITTSLARSSNNYKAAFPQAVGEIKNFNVNGTKINFELHFYADAEARQLLAQVTGTATPTPAPMSVDGGIILRKNFSEEVSVIEAYSSEATSTSPTEILKECCELWLKDKHYPEA